MTQQPRYSPPSFSEWRYTYFSRRPSPLPLADYWREIVEAHVARSARATTPRDPAEVEIDRFEELVAPYEDTDGDPDPDPDDFYQDDYEYEPYDYEDEDEEAE